MRTSLVWPDTGRRIQISDLPTITDPGRLAAVEATGLLDSEAEPDFDRLAQIAARLLSAPMAFVIIIGADRQYFISAVDQEGLAPQAGESVELERSISKHVIAGNAPFLVEDARDHSLLRDNKALEEGVIAFAGIALRGPGGHAVGTLSVIDTKPRVWSADDVEILTAIAASATRLIKNRTGPGRSGDAQVAAAASPDPLLDIVARHLRAAAWYEDLVTRPSGVSPREEAGAQLSVITTMADLRDALSGEGSPTLRGELASAARRYVEASAERRRISSAFHSGTAALADFQASIARSIDAADMLRVTALDHGAQL